MLQLFNKFIICIYTEYKITVTLLVENGTGYHCRIYQSCNDVACLGFSVLLPGCSVITYLWNHLYNVLWLSYDVQVGIEFSCLCNCSGNKERCSPAEVVSKSIRFGSVWASKMYVVNVIFLCISKNNEAFITLTSSLWPSQTAVMVVISLDMQLSLISNPVSFAHCGNSRPTCIAVKCRAIISVLLAAASYQQPVIATCILTTVLVHVSL